MLEALEGIFHVVTSFPTVVLWAVEEFLDDAMEAFALAVEAAASVLPSLPETLGPPEYVESINWFVPLGALLSIAGTLVTAYVTWMAVRWLFAKFGEQV